ncbi:MAG TPA: acyltransferase [Bacteroidales bacterium]|nr:acyltransferase [Bacteroidales bacterium]HPT10679.1 acyltransferase [Bacteroidales bacterium]
MGINDRLRSNGRMKKVILFLLMPRNQARPRRWVRWFVNPWIHHRGKHSRIRPRTRMDVLPFNKFHLGDASTIEDFTTINNGVGDIYIGHRTRIGLGCTLIGPVHIGNDIRLAQNIVMSGLNHNYEDLSKPISEQGVTTAPIVVEDESWIGSNSVVLPGVTIGKHCVVAAGSIVTKDVPPYSVVAGNPARVVKQYVKASKSWERT